MLQTSVETQVPVVDKDPFGLDTLADPFDFQEELREAGPVVWLEKYGLWGLGRYEHVHATLNDWETFCSSAGVGISDFRKEKPWREPSILLEKDPPEHTRARSVMTKVLSPVALRKLRADFEAVAEKLVDEVVEQGEFDAATDLAEAFPIQVFPDALGLTPHERGYLLRYGNIAFNAFGPRNSLFEASMAEAPEVSAWIIDKCRREALSENGFGAQIFAQADQGDITEHEAGMLVRSLLTAGVDTTVNGIGCALRSLAANPDQWQVLRDNPSLVRNAFEETLRYDSPVQTFFRTTTREVDIEGVKLGEGEKVLMFLGAANRDPRRWENPDRFDVQRKATGHVAFGSGIHGCVGQMVARLEAEVVISALLKRVKTLELAGEPTAKLNNTLRGWAHIPVSVTAA
jgi:4-methoxybenzoate monooxygenase (O-demethylating)